jgi:2-aminoethylphosphonate transport system permease protein
LSNGADGITISHFGDVVRTQLFWSALLSMPLRSLLPRASGVSCSVFTIPLYFVPFPGARDIAPFIDTFIALPTFLIALAFTFIYGSAGVINIQFFAFDLPPIDFLYSIWGVILAEVTVYTPFVLRPLLAAFSLIEAS